MKKRYWLLSSLFFFAAFYLAGPKPKEPEYNLFAIPALPAMSGDALENYVAQKESKHKVKQGNEAKIIWADDSLKNKTKLSVIYLHGFSASHEEGNPIHYRFAEKYGMNLYLARLADHGVDTTDVLLNCTVDRLWNSAKEALQIGLSLGEKVIILSTSTGSTLAMKLAATYPDKIEALIQMSPNVAINNSAAFLLNDHWGLHIARMVQGSKYNITNIDTTSIRAQFWNAKYRLEALTELQELLETSMTDEVFSKIHQPVLNLYYYKNEVEQDPQVKVSAMLAMHEKLATFKDKKKAVAIPTAGAHVIGSKWASKDVEAVWNEIELFSNEILKLNQR
ncbi:MAG: alpha/beta hydrolase [Cyclobacteriaceae bacterium]|jgi:esterase/lipase|nr:alpha/beta hydrolase [Cyclobacteriaceae bacterium]